VTATTASATIHRPDIGAHHGNPRVRPAQLNAGHPQGVVRGMTACPHEEELLDALYAEYAGPLLEYVQRLLGGDRHQAEDVVQETLLRAWRHAETLSSEDARPWLSRSRGGSWSTGTAAAAGGRGRSRPRR
jgi:hypothetical protein